MQNNNLFSKEELRKKVFALREGKKPFADFTPTYVDELLDEMFPENKKVKLNAEVTNLGVPITSQSVKDKEDDDIVNERFVHFVLIEYD